MGDGWSPRRRLGGIRVRVVVGYVILVTSALAITVLVTRQVLLSRLDREIDRALVQEVEELRLLVDGIDPATGEPFGDDVRAVFDTFLRRTVPADNEAFYTFVDGRAFLYSFDAPPELLDDDEIVSRWASVTEPERRNDRTALGDVRSLAVPVRSGTDVAGVFVASYFPANDRDEALQAVRVITVAGLVVLVVSAGVAWTLAGRVLRPVRELTQTAQSISDADLSRRIPVHGHDELAELGSTFNEMVDRLESGFVGQRQFLDDVAHELRTPITIVQGHLDLLGDDPEERAETLHIVGDELDRMSRYVTDLLVLAKAEQPDFLKLAVVDLGELADAVMQKVQGLGPRRWVCDAAPTPGQVATIGDQGRLEQALLNLAVNAVQHTDTGDEIGIGIDAAMSNDPPMVRLWVRDTGPGVEPAVADSLFRRHTRGAASRTVRADGMGIGLSIVDAIARAHHGEAAVQGDTAGATFVIAFPLDTGPTATEVFRSVYEPTDTEATT
jgi:two-component system, OmpR family, sensor kinase